MLRGAAPRIRHKQITGLVKRQASRAIQAGGKSASHSVWSELRDDPVVALVIKIRDKQILRRRASADQTDYGETQDPAY